MFASAADWREYAGSLVKALKKEAGQSRAAAKEARRLTASAKSAGAKLTAIRDFMALRVRETEPGLTDMPLDRVSPADRTLGDGYGNTTDRAVLFYAMLDAAGFSPEFVLASQIPAIDSLGARLRASPAASVFSRVLVRVRERAGAEAAEPWIYLNDTDQYAALGATRHAGKFGLFLPSGDLGEILPARPDIADTRYRIEIDPKGDVKLAKRQWVQGNEFGAENKRFAEMTPEERRRYHQEMIALVSQGAEADGELKTDFSGYPGVIEFAVRIPRFAASDGWFLYFLFPEFLENVLDMKADTRTNPLLFANRREKKVRLEIVAPPGFQPAYLPPDIHLRDAAGAGIAVSAHVSAESRKEGLTVVAEATAWMAPAVAPAARYRELLDLDEALSRKHARTVLLRVERPAPASTNAPAGP